MKKITIYDGYNFDAYEEMVKENFELDGVDDYNEWDLWNAIHEAIYMNWEDRYEELKDYFSTKTCLMVGTAGRWYGVGRGGMIGSFEDCFTTIMKDCDYWSFEDNNGHLELTCSHHDGTNCVEFFILTDKGCTYADNWEYGYGDSRYDYDEATMHQHLVNCSLLARLPHFAKKVYGYGK